MVKEIELLHGEKTLVDDEDYEELNKYQWYLYGRYARSPNKSGNKNMARCIMNAKRGQKGQTVDHINGNTIDNRRCNLRIGSDLQNMQNVKYKIGESGYRGVHKDGYIHNCPVWKAVITKDNIPYILGRFVTTEDAANAYDKAAIEFYGENAMTNKRLLLL